MSIFWKNNCFGYDGDFLHGRVAVHYWQDREKVETEIDKQLAEIRTSMLAEYPRLSGQESDTGAP